MITESSGSRLDVYLETLRRLVLELGPQRSFQSALRVVLRTLAQRHAFLRPHLVIYDPQARALRLCLADTPPAAEGVVYEPGMGITGQVFTLGRPVIVERLCENTVFQNKFFSRTPEEMASLAFLSVPVLGQSEEPSEGLEVLGVLSMDTPVAPRPVLEEQSRFLEVVAGLIGNQSGYLQREIARQWAVAPASPGLAQEAAPPERVIVAASKVMRHVLARAGQVAASCEAVLLRGEAGTGKDLLAEVIHRASPRRDMPLRYVNCAALVAEGMEETLFGVQKGASPQALQTRKGMIEQAHLGTIYLHGVECLPETLQTRLLHAMQESALYRMGGTQPVRVDVRFICGTQRSAEELQAARLLHGNLLPQFPGWLITTPPLRERTEDILPLAEEFLRMENAAQGKHIRRISTTAIDLLLRYLWPGNAHELKNCVQRAVAACEDDAILAWHLPPSLQTEDAREAGEVSFSDAVTRFEQELLVGALQKTRGNMLEASRLLGASYRIINYKVKKYGLDPRKFLSR